MDNNVVGKKRDWAKVALRSFLAVTVLAALILLWRMQKIQMMFEIDPHFIEARATIGVATVGLDTSRVIDRNEDGHLVSGFLLRAAAYIKLGDYALAQQDFQSAEEISGPLRPISYYMMAKDFELTAPTLADKYYQKAIEAYPQHFMCTWYRAKFLMTTQSPKIQNAPATAVEMMEKTIELYDRHSRKMHEEKGMDLFDWPLQKYMAMALAKNKDYQKALMHGKKALALATSQITIEEGSQHEKLQKRSKRDILLILEDLIEDYQEKITK